MNNCPNCWGYQEYECSTSRKRKSKSNNENKAVLKKATKMNDQNMA